MLLMNKSGLLARFTTRLLPVHPPLGTPAAHRLAQPRCAFQESRSAILRIRPSPVMNVEARGATRRMSRLVRWLAGRNALRRPVDRIEGAVLVVLSAAFLAAVAVASVLGAHTYQSQRAASVGLRPAVAVLVQAGPFYYGGQAQLGKAEARWRAAVGGGAGIALLISYALCRLALNRRRLAAWESAWSLTGPRWTTHR